MDRKTQTRSQTQFETPPKVTVTEGVRKHLAPHCNTALWRLEQVRGLGSDYNPPTQLPCSTNTPRLCSSFPTLCLGMTTTQSENARSCCRPGYCSTERRIESFQDPQDGQEQLKTTHLLFSQIRISWPLQFPSFGATLKVLQWAISVYGRRIVQILVWIFYLLLCASRTCLSMF